MRATYFAAAKIASISRALAAGSAAGPGQSMARLPGASGQICGAPGASAARASVTGGERIVFDGDELGGVLRRGGAFGDDHRHRLADMQDPLGGKRRAVRHDERLAASPDERRMPADAADPSRVRGGQDSDDAGRTQRGLEVDSDDAGESMRRAHEEGVGLIRQRRVGGVAAVAAQEDVVLDARRSGRARSLGPGRCSVFASMLCAGNAFGVGAGPL